MNKLILILFLFFLYFDVSGQDIQDTFPSIKDSIIINKDSSRSHIHVIDTLSVLNKVRSLYTPDYLDFKKQIIGKFRNDSPGRFGEFVEGSFEELDTDEKVIAFTFDACVGWKNTYNAALIDFLRRENVPATLFIGGTWITTNADIFQALAKDTLFEIENHGLLHRVCSVNGRSAYGVWSTKNMGEVIDEMELNSRRIQSLTGRRPQYFRSATAYCDELSAKIASELGMQMVSYSLLSEDAIPGKPAESITRNILSNAKNGAIVIMHFNHPDWHEKEALEIVIPMLRKEGYRFVKLEGYRLKRVSCIRK